MNKTPDELQTELKELNAMESIINSTPSKTRAGSIGQAFVKKLIKQAETLGIALKNEKGIPLTGYMPVSPEYYAKLQEIVDKARTARILVITNALKHKPAPKEGHGLGRGIPPEELVRVLVAERRAGNDSKGLAKLARAPLKQLLAEGRVSRDQAQKVLALLG